MFKLKPPKWYLKSTIGNITLIQKFRKSDGADQQPEEKIFNFWLEYFHDACDEDSDNGNTIRYAVITERVRPKAVSCNSFFSKMQALIWEPTKVFVPSYVTVNNSDDEKTVQIWNLCINCFNLQTQASKVSKCKQVHNWLLTSSELKSLT